MGKLFSIWLIETVVSVYDIVTLPFYYLIQQPWRVQQVATRVRARQVEPFTWTNIDNKLDKSSRSKVHTLDQLFRDSVSTYAAKDCLGIRKILAIEYKQKANQQHQNGATNSNKSSAQRHETPTTTTDNERAITKYVLDDKYTWFTYKQVEEMVVNLSSGLTSLCSDSLKNQDGSRKLLICADTCMQWFLVAHACFRNNVTVVTAYTTLDDEAILQIFQETEVRILVVSQKFSGRLRKIAEQSPLVDTIIVLDEPLPGQEDCLGGLKALLGCTGVKRLLSYNDLIARGRTSEENILVAPTKEDIAVIMYTSGSTGKAKGVMLNHNSIVYTALSFSGPGDISDEDRYIGYLPLGHVLELAAECIFLRNGSTIAYSSPMTLTNNSPMIKKGQYGDAYIFRPTIMGAVPLVLDRIKSGVQQAVKSQGTFYDQLINDFVIRYKRHWFERCYDTPIMNFLICRKFNMVLGGRMRAICSGGAALSRETQEYLRHVTNYTVLQGYGLTETSAAASFCDVEERRYNVVGPPYPTVRIKLESWSDYSIHDKPHPRGEVLIGGQPVTAGYYKNDELTKESFFTDPNSGVRYFRTGDIGLILPDGVLKIIDRKKDIVKPLSGEYVSLSEVEVALRTASVVEIICVYCSQYSNYLVALVKPDPKELMREARELFRETSGCGEKFRDSIVRSHLKESGNQNGVDSGDTYSESILDSLSLEELCSNKWLVEHVLKLLQNQGKEKKLKRTHIPSKIKIVIQDWSPESGLVTGSFKLRRREIERFYANDIKQLYAELGQKIEQQE